MDAENRMTEGSIGGKMIRFAIPLFIGNLFQQLYNTADALIVGNLLGNDALAAVSATGTLVFLLVSFFNGMYAGAGVVVSRYFGAKETDKVQAAIHTNVAVTIISGIILTVIGTAFTPTILNWMGTPEDVMAQSVKYVQIYFAGGLGLVMYNSLRGIMQALGDSRHPLHYLIFSSVLNVILDLLFIGVFRMDVGGAALATIIAQFLSALLCLVRLMRSEEAYRLSLRKIRIDWPMFRLIINYGLPSGLQNSVIAIANVVVQSNINAFGTNAVSGCGAYSKIEGFAFLPITSFTIAITTFVGQNLGAKEYERTRKGAKIGIFCSLLLAEAVGIIVYIAAPFLIGLFTSEPEAIAFGVQKARTCAIFYFLLASSHCLAAVLRGVGKAVIPMAAMLICWCVIRVSILQICVPIFQSIAVVNWVYPITWSLSTAFLIVYYIKVDWMHGFDEKKPARHHHVTHGVK